MNGVTTVSFLKNLNSTLSKKNSITSSRINGQLNNSVGMQTGKNLFTKTVDAVTPAKQNGDLPKFSSTKEDAPGYVPPKDSGELKNVSELPGYQPIIGSSVNIPGRNKALGKAFVKAGAIAAAVSTTIPVGKILDKWDQVVDTATEYVSNSVIPKVKKVKAKASTRIRKIAGMDPHIPKR